MIRKELKTIVFYGHQKEFVNYLNVRKKLGTTVFYGCQKG
jgi:hypothetical protein